MTAGKVARIRARRKARGRCIDCGRLLASGETCRCSHCKANAVLTTAFRSSRYREEGRCIRCGKQNPEPKYATCPVCRSKMAWHLNKKKKSEETKL